jgi:hypothetical protein
MYIKALIQKLSKFYWTPMPPEHYTITVLGKKAGIGLVAWQDYAAFNYAWAANTLDLNTEAGQVVMLREWALARSFTSVPVLGQELSWFFTSQTLPEFRVWYMDNRQEVGLMLRPKLDRLVPNELQSLQ